MSTSAPAIGLPALSWTRADMNSVGPGVSERMIEPPFATGGEFSRQNGPSKDCEVSVWPLSPLLSRQISEEMPSEPAISTISLWLSVVSLPISTRMAVASRNSFSVRRTSRTKPWRCLTRLTMISRSRGSSVRSITAITAGVTSPSCRIISTPSVSIE